MPSESLILRLLLLQELAVGLSDPELDRQTLLKKAQEGLSWIFSGARLELLPPDALPEGTPLRGRFVLQGAPCYVAHHPGPPEPRWIVLWIPHLDHPEELRLAALFIEHFWMNLRSLGYREELDRQARSDWLTGLGNRFGLIRKLAQGLPSGWGVVLIDLDGLKEINDWEGHASGDQLLKGFAQALKELAGEAYRLGGDEFAALLPEEALPELRRRLAERGFRFSLGWAGEATSVEGLLELADRRMYREKKAKRGLAPS